MSASGTGEAEVPRFARGFLLSQSSVESPVPGWSTESVLGLQLVRAPEVQVTQAEHAGSAVVVLGHLVDTGRWLPTVAAVSAAAEALAVSETAFLDLTDAWSGRYLVLYGDATSRRVMTDAAGMRSAFYALDGPFLLASHARLVADRVAAAPSGLADAYRATKQAQPHGLVLPMPGRSTPWIGVVALTANVALEVEARRLHLIFPRGALPTIDAPSAAATIGPRLVRQVDALVASGHPVELSVTAGRDSRVSLAASRTCRDALGYFTYTRVRSTKDEWDVATARSMAAELGLTHRVVEVDPAELTAELREALHEATILSHSGAIVAAYRRSFTPDTIHIRSNIGEVGRDYYRGKSSGKSVAASGRALTADAIAHIWAHRAPVSPVVVEAFDDWMQAVGFSDVEGMDPFDVLYWEHRMPCWHSNVVLESDFAFETHVLFNARSILRDMLAVPAEDRASSRVFELLVADLWPELARWPYQEPEKQPSSKPAQRAGAGACRRRIGRWLGH